MSRCDSARACTLQLTPDVVNRVIRMRVRRLFPQLRFIARQRAHCRAVVVRGPVCKPQQARRPYLTRLARCGRGVPLAEPVVHAEGFPAGGIDAAIYAYVAAVGCCCLGASGAEGEGRTGECAEGEEG